MLLGFGWAVWSLLLQEPEGRLRLETHGPSLRAEVTQGDRAFVAARFRVPHEEPALLRPGDYRIRLSAPGLLSSSFLASVGPGELDTLPGEAGTLAGLVPFMNSRSIL